MHVYRGGGGGMKKGVRQGKEGGKRRRERGKRE
jgi:hypothetical protein